MAKKNSKTKIFSGSEVEKRQKQAKDRLAKTTNIVDVLKWAAIFGWFKSGNNTLCPKAAIPLIECLMNFLDQCLKKGGRGMPVWGENAGKLAIFLEGVAMDDSDQTEGDLPHMGLGGMLGKTVGLKIRGRNAVVLLEWLLSGAIRAENLDWLNAVFFQAHKVFLFAEKKGFVGEHPLLGPIGAWQKEMTALQVTKAVDRSFPVALRLPFGAVSAEEIEAAKDYHLPVFEPLDSQMILNLSDARTNQLARHLPIRSWLADWNTPGPKPRGGRGGSVPLWLRLFLEALVCADRFSGSRTVYYELAYLYSLAYGDNARWDIVRVRQLRQMIDVASRAVVVLSDGGEVLPVNFNYFEGLERKSKIFVEVAAVRNARNGALTAIGDLRDAYRASNATLQAYLSATEYLDRVWTRNTRLLYETVPKRNDDGVILDHLGKPMITKTGKPLKSLKDADGETLAQVKRIPNPKFTPDPVTIDELVGVCWADNSIPKSQRREYKKRALTAWRGLPVIDLEEDDQSAVIIRPSKYHRKTYNAIKKSGSKSKK